MLSSKVDVALEATSAFVVLEEIGVSLHQPTFALQGCG
jgi:hypothetical protein